jgi:hypothetical protein
VTAQKSLWFEYRKVGHTLAEGMCDCTEITLAEGLHDREKWAVPHLNCTVTSTVQLNKTTEIQVAR